MAKDASSRDANFCCTPSKSLIRAARAAHQASDCEKSGYKLGGAPAGHQGLRR